MVPFHTFRKNSFDMPQDGREFVSHFSVPVRTLSIADERFFGLEEYALCVSEARSQKIYSGERTMALYAHFSSIGGLEVSDAGGRQWEISRLWLAMAPCHRIVGNHPMPSKMILTRRVQKRQAPNHLNSNREHSEDGSHPILEKCYASKFPASTFQLATHHKTRT